MKKIVMTICLALLAALAASTAASAQNRLNDSADSILGQYMIREQGNDTKVLFTKNADGTYDCVITWMEDTLDPATGKPWTDIHNPDKSLRNVPLIGLKLIKGLPYNAQKKNWSGAKIYDPNRGIRANVTIRFSEDGRMQLRGSVLGIGETVYWDPIKE